MAAAFRYILQLMARGLLVGCLLSAAAACREPVAEPRATSASAASASAAAPSAAAAAGAGPSERELDDIAAFVQKSQKEGIGGRDPAAFMRIWAPGARIVSGRREMPEAYDVTFEYASLGPTAEARSRGRQEAALAFRYDQVHAEAVGEEVRLRWQLTVDWTASSERGRDQSAETYRLRRGPEGWRVIENRVWPLAQAVGASVTRFDERYWAEREAELAAAGKDRDPLAAPRALSAAWHFREAYEAIQAVTRARPKDAAAWALQARLADQLRLIPDTIAAYQRLAALDPKAPIPGWVAVHPAWHGPR